MNAMSSSNRNDLYSRIKRFEKKIKATHNRAPTKEDLDHYPRFRELYKEYAVERLEKKRRDLENAKLVSKENVVAESPCKPFCQKTKENAYMSMQSVIADSPMQTWKYSLISMVKKQTAFIPPSPSCSLKTSTTPLKNSRAIPPSPYFKAIPPSPCYVNSPLRNCGNTEKIELHSQSSELVVPSPLTTGACIRPQFRLSAATRNIFNDSPAQPKSQLKERNAKVSMAENLSRSQCIGKSVKEPVPKVSNTSWNPFLTKNKSKSRLVRRSDVARKYVHSPATQKLVSSNWQNEICASPIVKNSPIASRNGNGLNSSINMNMVLKRDLFNENENEKSEGNSENENVNANVQHIEAKCNETLTKCKPVEMNSSLIKHRDKDNADRSEQTQGFKGIKTGVTGVIPKKRTELTNNYVKINLKKGYRRKTKMKTFRGSGFSSSTTTKRKYLEGENITASCGNQSTEYKRKRDRDPRDTILDCLDTLPNCSIDEPDAKKRNIEVQQFPTSLETSYQAIPLCPGHQMPCIINVVKKSNKNKGRQYYTCSQRTVGKFGKTWGGCGYFSWVDDTKNFAVQAFRNDQTDEQCQEERIVKLKEQWNGYTMEELRSLLRKYNQKKTSGKKTELIAQLEECAQEHIRIAGDITFNPEEDDIEKVSHSVLDKVFGFPKFRGEQLWAIKRVMNGESTLLVQATGSGKSLCYQLPALLLPGLTVVISPLVSLMEDQLKSLPFGLTGACLSGKQSAVQTAETLKWLKNGQIKVLFISPERLFSSSFQRLLRTPGMIPPVSLACVDEAHCISSWSHNFRPSYLRLRKLLTDHSNNNPNDKSQSSDTACLNAQCVLALTATATNAVAEDICKVLNINDREGRKIGSSSRHNLEFMVKELPEERRFNELSKILSDDGALCKPARVIIYVQTRYQTETVAEQLRGKGHDAKSYHAGMTGPDRSKIMGLFMRDKIRIIVATVAFGMGIDKSNVRGVVHFGMPRSVEDYVQEVGRAGRDGKRSVCVSFFDAHDARRAHSLAHSDGITRYQVKKLLKKISRVENFQEAALMSSEIESTLDIKEGVLETILVHLSLHKKIQLLPSGYALAKCSVVVLNSAALANDLIYTTAYSMSIEVLAGLQQNKMDFSFHVDVVARRLKLSVSQVIRSFCLLRDDGIITFELSEPCFFFRPIVDMQSDDFDLDALIENLLSYTQEIESAQVAKVEMIYSLMKKANDDKETISKDIDSYFKSKSCTSGMNDSGSQLIPIPFLSLSDSNDRFLILLRSDIKVVLADSQLKNARIKPSGRVVARILHGISSPIFSHALWRSHPLWGKRKDVSFIDLCALADAIIKEQRNS